MDKSFKVVDRRGEEPAPPPEGEEGGAVENEAVFENPLSVYRDGVSEVLLEAISRGQGGPLNQRVLLRAITMADIFGGGGIVTDRGDNPNQAPLHEIVALPPDAPEGLEVGMHCMHISAAADDVDIANASKYALVRADHLIAAWGRPQG